MNCPQCQSYLTDEATVCPVCGTAVQQAAPAVNAQPAPTAPAKKGFNKKLIIPIVAAVVMIAAIVAIVLCFCCGGEPDPEPQPHGLYIQGNSLMYVDASTGESFEITSDLGDFQGTETDEYGEETTYNRMSSRDILIVDNDTVFFPIDYAKESDTMDTFTLCVADLEDGAEVTEIAEEVYGYTASADGKVVVYQTADTDLYRYVDGESEKIASDGFDGDYQLSLSGEELIYSAAVKSDDDTDYALYYKAGDEDAVKLANEYDDVYFIDDDDFSTFYFTSNEKLYRVVEGEADRIASDVKDVRIFPHNEYLYYTSTRGAKEANVGDYIIDPEDEYSYDYYKETAVEALYYFDGEESTLIDDCIYLITREHEESPLLSYRSFANVKKDSLKDFYEAPTALVAETTVVALPDGAAAVAIAEDGETIAYTITSKDGKSVTAYTATIDGEAVVDEEEVITAEGINGMEFTVDNALFIATFKNTTKTDEDGYETYETTYSYYLGSEEIAKNVKYSCVEFNAELGYALFSETKDNKTSLSFYSVESGDIVDLTDNLYDHKCELLETGDVMYLADYDKTTKTGTLYTYTNGEEIKVDSGVSKMLTCYYLQ